MTHFFSKCVVTHFIHFIFITLIVKSACALSWVKSIMYQRVAYMQILTFVNSASGSFEFCSS
jgi:hypothetical protein